MVYGLGRNIALPIFPYLKADKTKNLPFYSKISALKYINLDETHVKKYRIILFPTSEGLPYILIFYSTCLKAVFFY